MCLAAVGILPSWHEFPVPFVRMHAAVAVMLQTRCGDAVITLLCGAGMFQPPSIATKSDPQPSILTRGALHEHQAQQPTSVQLERLGKVCFVFAWAAFAFGGGAGGIF